jgi:hypothetical protein
MPIGSLGFPYDPLTGKVTVSSSSGQKAVVAAVSGKKILVLSVIVTTDTAQIIKFQSASTDITASHPVAASGGFVLPYNPCGWFETIVSQALNINLSTTSSLGATIVYCLI